MNTLPPRPVFTESDEFIGWVSQGELATNPLHIVVRYSLVQNGPIQTFVLGTADSVTDVLRLVKLSGPPLRVNSRDDSGGRWELSVHEAHWGSITKPHAGFHSGGAAVGIVASLTPHDLTITRKDEALDSAGRVVTFLLTGPRRPWNVVWIGERSYLGKQDIHLDDHILPLDIDLPFEVRVLPWFVYDKDPEHENVTLTTNVLSLQFKTSLSMTELPNEILLQRATTVADDILLLMSFAARRWCTWYAVFFSSKGERRTQLRRARECSTIEPDWNDTLIEPERSSSFLRTAISEFSKSRAKGCDLYMPLVYYISGAEAKHMEEQFTTFFLALERINDQFRRSQGVLDHILSNKEFDLLVKGVKQKIRVTVPSPENRKLMYEKIRELNRPAFSSVLTSLLAGNRVDWQDLYPLGRAFTIVKTRDSLFHTSGNPDFDSFSLELIRLQSLVERLLLLMLGWRDFSRSPSDPIKKWLTDPNQSGNRL